MKLRGKVAVVTGSGVGIGRSIAERFSREGASVVLTDVNAAWSDGTRATGPILGGAPSGAILIRRSDGLSP
jgi:NAD(P)-dependent dehydrogenase (short-subunit alcohol dehydrogenase family)